MEEIIVTTQAQLNAIPIDFNGRIIVRFGTPGNRAIINKQYKYWVVADRSASVEASGNAMVEAWENASVEASENASVVARENASVEAWGNASVVAWENVSVEAGGNASVVAWENASVVAWDNVSVEAGGNASVVAWGNASVVAWGNASVEAWENVSVEAGGNVQVVDRQRNGKITISGNARIVYMPKTITEFMDFYGIQHTDTTAIFYKAVHKNGDKYISDYDRDFVYTIGKTATEDCDLDTREDCGRGLHICYLDWALRYGSAWPDLAILEVTTDINKIVLPDDTEGKVRTSELTVIREVPLEDCGVYGKMLAQRRKRERVQ